jgi:hypothetical protein
MTVLHVCENYLKAMQCGFSQPKYSCHPLALCVSVFAPPSAFLDCLMGKFLSCSICITDYVIYLPERI